MSDAGGNAMGNGWVYMPVKLDGQSDLDDILARLILPPGWVPAVCPPEVELEPAREPKHRGRRAMRAECWPFPDTR